MPNIFSRFYAAVIPLKVKVGFIGDGNMAKAIAKAIVRKGLTQSNRIYVSSPFFKNLESWKRNGANISTDNGVVTEEADVIFLAVKPHIFEEAIQGIATVTNKMEDKLFISIMAGAPISSIENVSWIFLQSIYLLCLFIADFAKAERG